MDLERAHRIAREKGANRVVYWIVRAILQPFFHVYFRVERHGRKHVPASGPLLLAANHRSFCDPFLIGLCLRRPLHFVAKRELFDRWWKARLLLALGAFPVSRGESDELAMETARIILERGGAVGIFPEGTRVRPGPLGEPRRGVGRLALETGAPIVPVAIAGTEDIRRGWRVRPRKARLRCGRPLNFPRPVDGTATPHLAREVTARAWSCVQLQWEWLGGMPPLRTVAVVGAGSWGTAAAVLLARAGASVRLGCRTEEQVDELRKARMNHRYLPGVELPDQVSVSLSESLDLRGVDLVCLAVPSRSFADAAGRLAGRLPEHAGVLLLNKGLVPPDGALPTDHFGARLGARPLAVLGGPAHAGEACTGRAGLVVASDDRAFAARLVRAFVAAGVHAERSDDVVGVQLAGCAKNAAALAVGLELANGANAAGIEAGRIYGECYRLADRLDAHEHSFAGLAGAGDLVATVLAAHSRNRRAGELLAQGATVEDIERRLGQASEALDLVPLLARAARDAGVEAPALRRLAALIESRRGAHAPGAAREAERAAA